ncbi:MAG: DinB family protein [Armatimonadetes bacterium]|nr:DinB family protein [Armatimonadota bacterium]
MHPDLLPQWERAEALKTDILAKAAAVPESLRGVAPKPGAWSPLEVVSHLGVAERFVIGYAGGSPDAMPPSANPVVIGLLCGALSAGVALPAPEIMMPEVNGKSLETLAQEWDAVRNDFYAEIATASPDTPYGVHPMFGTLSVQQTMEMLMAHTAYHYKRFPKTTR